MRVPEIANLAVVVGVILLAGASSGMAQSRDISVEGMRSEGRVALVIGNDAYPTAVLRNPVNDARAMARTLGDLGFTVLAHENATKHTMETAILEFGRRLAEGGVGFFYYAGHGLQVRGRNYLVPVDAKIDSEAATRIAAVDVELLLEQMAEARNRVNVVILDACRNNPFERRLRGAASRGLAAVDAARGTLIAYATAPGSVAADGEAANGLYTEELVQALRVPGLKVEEVFKRVRVGVTSRSKGAQTPWESSSLTGDLIINVTVNVTAPAAPAATSSPTPTADREALFWTSIAGGSDPAAFEAYLRQYPEGAFAALARQRLASLDVARFDGTWRVTVQCPAFMRALSSTKKLLAQVKDGLLRAQVGDEGQPSWMVMTARIHPDGSADVEVNGLSGDPKYTSNNQKSGSPFAYHATARFEDRRGVGKRIEYRPCDLTFVKQ